MADQRNGGIAWSDETWNPVRGCSRVSEGCRNCYAETMAARFSGVGQPYEGLAKMTPSGPRWTGEVRLVSEHLADPLRWKRPQRVFVNSMSDLFHEKLPDEVIAAVFGIMSAASEHTFQVLTKRAARMVEWFKWAASEAARRAHIDAAHFCTKLAAEELRESGETKIRGIQAGRWPLPNVWIGVSAEDQATADERIPLLLQCPAAVRWVSYEPALGPVDFDGDAYSWRGWLRGWHCEPQHARGCDGSCASGCCPEPTQVQNERLDWIVVGGESGPGARPFDLAWARQTIAQCKAAGVPVFVKQLGAKHGLVWKLKDRKGGDMAEWPDDLRIREFPRKP